MQTWMKDHRSEAWSSTCTWTKRTWKKYKWPNCCL